jgi:hypothetical protein
MKLNIIWAYICFMTWEEIEAYKRAKRLPADAPLLEPELTPEQKAWWEAFIEDFSSFSLEKIKSMSPEEYERNRETIMRQIANGTIRK